MFWKIFYPVKNIEESIPVLLLKFNFRKSIFNYGGKMKLAQLLLIIASLFILVFVNYSCSGGGDGGSDSGGDNGSETGSITLSVSFGQVNNQSVIAYNALGTVNDVEDVTVKVVMTSNPAEVVVAETSMTEITPGNWQITLTDVPADISLNFIANAYDNVPQAIFTSTVTRIISSTNNNDFTFYMEAVDDGQQPVLPKIVSATMAEEMLVGSAGNTISINIDYASVVAYTLSVANGSITSPTLTGLHDPSLSLDILYTAPATAGTDSLNIMVKDPSSDDSVSVTYPINIVEAPIGNSTISVVFGPAITAAHFSRSADTLSFGITTDPTSDLSYSASGTGSFSSITGSTNPILIDFFADDNSGDVTITATDINNGISASLTRTIAVGDFPFTVIYDPPAGNYIKGVAATGMPVSGFVNVKGSAGNVVSTNIETDGSFLLNVETLNPPYILFAKGTAYGRSVSLYSTGILKGNINITPITSWIVSKALNGDPAEAYENWDASSDLITIGGIVSAEATVQSQIATVLEAYGIPSNVDLMTFEFEANHLGLDAVLDSLEITFDSNNIPIITNNITGTQITGIQSFDESEKVDVVMAIADNVAINEIFNIAKELWAVSLPSAEDLSNDIAPRIADDYLGQGKEKVDFLAHLLGDEGLPIGFDFSVTIYKKMTAAELNGYEKGYWTRTSIKSGSITFVNLDSFVFNGANWLLYGDRRWITFRAAAIAQQSDVFGESPDFKSGIKFDLEDHGDYAQNQGVLSGILTGPGLPVEGLILERQDLEKEFRWNNNGHWSDYYEFIADQVIEDIEENAEYEVKFYDVSADEVSLANESIYIISTNISGKPFLIANLTSEMFPEILTPETYWISDLSLNTGIEIQWNKPVQSAGCWARLYLGKDGAMVQYVDNLFNSGMDNSSSTFDTSDISFEPSWGNAFVAVLDVFGRVVIAGKSLQSVVNTSVNARIERTVDANSVVTDKTGLQFNINGGNNISFSDFGINSAIVTGPGLPIDGLVMEKHQSEEWFSIFGNDGSNFYDLTNDVVTADISGDTGYVINLYGESASIVTLANAVLLTKSTPISGKPILIADLTSDLFPTLISHTTHSLGNLNIGGDVLVEWTNPIGFCLNSHGVSWGEDEGESLDIYNWENCSNTTSKLLTPPLIP